ncbi:MAG: AGE family epimerase/isomerase [Phaeovulum sp.]|uniref:AGE family epimerase/isomerase n=1 Tax=Phaeovulum sp. TaxID=2934796 RepID=UPI00272FB126|nr:AGE family epimerase/isomerase [Phaeovulum sp.]MDP2062841.1 AGE family epimerase/isomerase [Phaeovulum sp.]
MCPRSAIGTEASSGSWLADPLHRAWLNTEAWRQLDFFRASLRPDGGFDVLNHDGTPRCGGPQELHTTTRLVHAYALGQAFGDTGASAIIDAGMGFLWRAHRDGEHGGYSWSVQDGAAADGSKLAYGHVFVLLAAASAAQVGHPDADRLVADVSRVIDSHFWDEARGLLRDEFRRDWQPFSTYRGMNANMHGAEAMLAAYEATGNPVFLARAGRILDFFLRRIAPAHGWRLPEHYTESWQVDPDYSGNPMFRPAGTTPGHSFELGRLILQHWDLSGRPPGDAVEIARQLVDRALADAWLPDGGFAYTLDTKGGVAIADRYWWPVTEAIGAMATLLKLDPRAADEAWYRRLWTFADARLIDHARGGWFPEIDAAGAPVERQFFGKPDIYHSLQATLLPLLRGASRALEELSGKAAAETARKPAPSAH